MSNQNLICYKTDYQELLYVIGYIGIIHSIKQFHDIIIYTLFKNTEKLKKLLESSWELLFYTISWLMITSYLIFQPFFYDYKLFTQNFMCDKLHDIVYHHHFICIAFYIHACFTINRNRKDLKLMLIHHRITIFLLVCSFILNVNKFGSLILFTTDCSDIFLHLSKIFKYTRKLNIAKIFFIIFVLSFIYLRFYIFGQLLFYALYTPVDTSIKSILIGCLVLLTSFNIYWLICIIRIIIVNFGPTKYKY